MSTVKITIDWADKDSEVINLNGVKLSNLAQLNNKEMIKFGNYKEGFTYLNPKHIKKIRVEEVECDNK